MNDIVKDWLAECTDGRVSKQTQQVLVAFANWQADRIAAMQVDAAPVAWMYVHPEGYFDVTKRRDDPLLPSWQGWTETPLYAHPPVDNRVSTSSPVDDQAAPETSVKLRDAVAVWTEAFRTWDREPGYVQAVYEAAAVIEADREAVRTEQAAELAKFKALAETLAFMLEAGTRFMPSSATVWHREAAKALRQYKEARDER